MAKELPAFCPQISSAAGCYSEVKRLTGQMNALISDNFSEKTTQAIADPDIRRSFSDLILEIRDKEQQALTHMERLLA